MPVAYLKDRNLGRIVAGHPWIYATDILRTEKTPADGEEITVRSANGNYVGNGFYNSKSQIPIRIFSRSKEKLDVDFDPARTSVFLCGNPAMIHDVGKILEPLGYTAYTTQNPGSLHTEEYW